MKCKEEVLEFAQYLSDDQEKLFEYNQYVYINTRSQCFIQFYILILSYLIKTWDHQIVMYLNEFVFIVATIFLFLI